MGMCSLWTQKPGFSDPHECPRIMIQKAGLLPWTKKPGFSVLHECARIMSQKAGLLS
jgi:hypothetical protein